jgi:hypothetical protein
MRVFFAWKQMPAMGNYLRLLRCGSTRVGMGEEIQFALDLGKMPDKNSLKN